MSSRKLEHLAPSMLANCVEFELRLRGAGIAFVRACTYRSDEEQAALHAIGRTEKGRIVTWCEAGKSKHNNTINGNPASLAADYYPLMNGKLAGDKSPDELALWERMGTIGESCGLIWGGRRNGRKRDRPHFEMLWGTI